MQQECITPMMEGNLILFNPDIRTCKILGSNMCKVYRELRHMDYPY